MINVDGTFTAKQILLYLAEDAETVVPSKITRLKSLGGDGTTGTAK